MRPAISAFIELGRPGRWFAPSFGAAFVGAPASNEPIASSDRSARFGYFGARVTVCPLAWTPTEHLEIAPCLGADFGRLTASTDYPDPLPPVAQFWGKGFVQARIRWNFWGPLFGETFGGGGVTFYDDSFEVELPGRRKEEFKVPRAVADLGIGMGAYFP
jgi:hypothetical protein